MADKHQKNTKRKIAVLFIILIILAVLGGGIFLFTQNKSALQNTKQDTSPFGTVEENTTIVPPQNTQSDDTKGGWIGDVAQPQIFQIHKEAIAGYYPLEKDIVENGSKYDAVRYIERGVGHIFETTMNNLTEKKLSNKTRPKIYEAVWGNNGDSVIIRYLNEEDEKTIRSFVIELIENNNPTILDEEVPSQELQTQEVGVFLPENIKTIASLESSDDKIFYLLERNDSLIGAIYSIPNRTTQQIFQSPFTEWLAQWPNESTIILTTKPSGVFKGYAYTLDKETGDLTRIIGGINGLTTLSNNTGKKILYSESVKNWVTLNLYKVDTKKTVRLPFSTLPEKCVWSKKEKATLYCAVPNNPQQGIYPDEWYQGVKTFSDSIWKVNTETLVTEEVMNIVNVAGDEIDAIALQLSADEKYLYFINKKDLSLWGIKLHTDTQQQNTKEGGTTQDTTPQPTE